MDLFYKILTGYLIFAVVLLMIFIGGAIASIV